MTRSGLCFDATGTLIEMTASVGETYAEIALAHGVKLPAWRLDDAFRRVLRSAPAMSCTGSTFCQRQARAFEWWSERIRQTFQAADSTIRFDDFAAFARALFESYREPSRWRPRPFVTETLERLIHRGHRMAIVSNFDYRLPFILEGLDLKRFFPFTLIPADSGMRKPDPQLFALAAQHFECAAQSLVYIGDDAQEVLAAIRSAGPKVIDIGALTSFDELPECIDAAAILSPLI